MKQVFMLVFAASLLACRQQPRSVEANAGEPPTLVDSLVQQARANMAAHLLDSATVSLRVTCSGQNSSYACDRLIGYDRRGSLYVYTSTSVDSSGVSLMDVASSEGVKQLRGTKEIKLTPKQRKQIYQEIHHIITLAFPLAGSGNHNDVQVYEGLDTLSGKTYHRIRIVTDKALAIEADSWDMFLWLNTDHLAVDLIGTDLGNDGKSRLYKAHNVRLRRGVNVQDYQVYKPKFAALQAHELLAALDHEQLVMEYTLALDDVRIDFNQ